MNFTSMLLWRKSMGIRQPHFSDAHAAQRAVRGGNKCLPGEMEMQKKKKKIIGRTWGIISIPLVEIKVDMMDPKLFLNGGKLASLWKVQRSPRHPKVLGDLVSKSLWWVLVVLLTGSHVSAVFSYFTSYLTLTLAAHSALHLWPLPPTLALSVPVPPRRWQGAACA